MKELLNYPADNTHPAQGVLPPFKMGERVYVMDDNDILSFLIERITFENRWKGHSSEVGYYKDGKFEMFNSRRCFTSAKKLVESLI